MTWIKLEDTLPTNPKIMALSDRAYRLHTYALCYCGLHLTDGLIPRHIVSKLGVNQAKTHAQKLVEIGLWIEEKEGYRIHDYLKHQTSKAQAEMEKETNRLRAQKARKAKAEALRNGVTNGVTHAKRSSTDTDTPTDSATDNKKIKIKVIKDDQPFDDSDFKVFWAAYPKKVKKQNALKSYIKALKTATPQQIFDGLIRYQRTCGEDPKYIANPDTWLNGERWNDEAAVSTVIIQRQPIPHKSINAPGQYGIEICASCGKSWPCSKSNENPF